MTEFTRYAVYFALDAGPLATFGAAWLGYDMDTGEHVPHPDVDGLPLPISEITEAPRKYGLHGTIKPPFRLAEGTSFNDLNTALDALCAEQPMIMLDGLRLARIGSFLALVVDGDQSALSNMAFAMVKGLDRFRAPATPADLERRRAANLTERQDKRLMEWGYPYVGDEFKFHITLTGKLANGDLDAMHKALAPLIAPLLPTPLVVLDLCLVGEDTAGQFHMIRRVPFGG